MTVQQAREALAMGFRGTTGMYFHTDAWFRSACRPVGKVNGKVVNFFDIVYGGIQ